MITSNNKQNKIQLAKVISKNLIFRNSADELFNYINNFKVSEIIIDFHKIQSITRSFAHQYLINKQRSEKNIIDVNISPHVKNMFELVGRTHKV
jgi:uncharacterized protein YaiL (DUF2058 family)